MGGAGPRVARRLGGTAVTDRTERLRELLGTGRFLHMPAVYHPLGARMVAAAGFEAAYVGGYVTGASRCVAEPLLTMTEQVAAAAEAAAAVEIPVVADGGAGWGDPLHTMRTVREFARAGIAGIHIEDQLFPKRAHYHKHQVRALPAEEFALKIRYACRERDRIDPGFVVIARTDTCREHGLEEAVPRLNRAADEGADLGLLFPRNRAEAEHAPRECRLKLVYVMSRGNRDGRPIFAIRELEQMGYAACIDAQAMLLSAYEASRRMLRELRETGAYAGLSDADAVRARKEIEDLIGLDEHYAIEEETVEGRADAGSH